MTDTPLEVMQLQNKHIRFVSNKDVSITTRYKYLLDHLPHFLTKYKSGILYSIYKRFDHKMSHEMSIWANSVYRAMNSNSKQATLDSIITLTITDSMDSHFKCPFEKPEEIGKLEEDIAMLLERGLSLGDIARMLNISEHK